MLKEVPRVVKECAYFTFINDKSGFDHVHIVPASQDVYGFIGQACLSFALWRSG